MDYANERWIKVYTRDTAGWLAMSWQAQGLGLLLSRKMEPTTGEISLGRKGLPTVIGLLGPTARWEDVEPFISELLEEGRLEYDDERKVLVDHDHPVRQGARTSGTARSQQSRAKRNAVQRDATPCNDQREEKEREEETESETRAREAPLTLVGNQTVELDEDLRAWAFTAGAPEPTKDHLVAFDLDAEKHGKVFPNRRAAFKSWMMRQKIIDARERERAQGEKDRRSHIEQKREAPAPFHKPFPRRGKVEPKPISAADLAAPLRALGVGS